MIFFMNEYELTEDGFQTNKDILKYEKVADRINKVNEMNVSDVD